MTKKELEMVGRRPDVEFWRGRRVLLTGHTGFKGSWLTWWLREMGSDVHGVSLPEPPSQPCLWEQLGVSGVTESRSDVAGGTWQEDARRFVPDVVLHLAAQPLVSAGYADPRTTYTTNVQGTVNVLDLVAQLDGVRACVVVTTDKVYDVRQDAPFAETAFLGGKDPYSASKAAAELVVSSWPSPVPTATARAGNVIGGGDWAADRLLPDLVRAWAAGLEVSLRMPEAIRPWQHVVEPLAGYLLFVEDLVSGRDVPSALNFGPSQDQAVAVGEVVDFAAAEWARLVPGSRLGRQVVGRPDMRETGVLTLDSTAASEVLDWQGHWNWREAVSRTLSWYVMAARGTAAAELVARDVDAYVNGSVPLGDE
ncbi:CDP-glucose 4,6-dehydratase [Oryzobacter telluris]|uniref:CDP-glucose 4,6-dehydratase n=1 Tax=Oryzobacter telluris TaxID=3149179 RepID=UPI00370D9352